MYDLAPSIERMEAMVRKHWLHEVGAKPLTLSYFVEVFELKESYGSDILRQILATNYNHTLVALDCPWDDDDDILVSTNPPKLSSDFFRAFYFDCTLHRP